MTTWVDIRKHVHDFIVAASEFPANLVIWERQGKPGPTTDYITLEISQVRTIGEDDYIFPESGRNTDQLRVNGQRDFLLQTRIFCSDYVTVGSAILNKAQNMFFAYEHLKQEQRVNVAIASFSALATYSIILEGVTVSVSSPGGFVDEEDILLAFVAKIATYTELSYLMTSMSEDASLLCIYSKRGVGFTFSTIDAKVTISADQPAVDLAYRGSPSGLLMVPIEAHGKFIGSGVVELKFGTHIAEIVEDMEYIEEVAITGTVGDQDVTVDVDDGS